MEKIKSIFSWCFGRLPNETSTPISNGLLCWVGFVAGIGIFLGDAFFLWKDPIPRGSYRMICHGGFALCLVAFLTGKRNWLAGLATATLAAPILFRVVLREDAIEPIQHHPYVLWGPSLVAFGLLLATGRKDWDKWGLSFGDWRWWIPRTGLFSIPIVLGVWGMISIDSSLSEVYPKWQPARESLDMLALEQFGYVLDLLGWEFLFRGFLLFAFARRDPLLAIWVQCLPFFVLHTTKPPTEYFLSLFGGFLGGWFCLRAKSFWPMFFLHAIQIMTVNIVGYAMG